MSRESVERNSPDTTSQERESPAGAIFTRNLISAVLEGESTARETGVVAIGSVYDVEAIYEALERLSSAPPLLSDYTRRSHISGGPVVVVNEPDPDLREHIRGWAEGHGVEVHFNEYMPRWQIYLFNGDERWACQSFLDVENRLYPVQYVHGSITYSDTPDHAVIRESGIAPHQPVENLWEEALRGILGDQEPPQVGENLWTEWSIETCRMQPEDIDPYDDELWERYAGPTGNEPGEYGNLQRPVELDEFWPGVVANGFTEDGPFVEEVETWFNSSYFERAMSG